MVANPVDALANANYLGILVWAVVLGIALRAASGTVKDVFASVSDAVSTVVRWVIALAPFGVLGLVYTTVSQNGLDIFAEYGRLLLVLAGCMVFIALVANPLIVFACVRANPYPLVLRCLKDSGVHGVLHAQLGGEHPGGRCGALPEARPRQGQLLGFHPAGEPPSTWRARP